MITEQNLRDLGFQQVKSPFTSKSEWIIGEEDVDVCGTTSEKQPIIRYDIDQQLAISARGEFCIISRKCQTEPELRKFVESISFLFNVSLNLLL